MTKQVARELRRTINDKEYPFFYNPMWSVFGDRTPGPSGTYYYRSSTPRVFFWNIFDQVLFRPSLFDSFEERVRVLDAVGGASLLNLRGIPDAEKYSDHLPILFDLNSLP